MCDVDRLEEIAQKNNLIIIEDAAQALGAEYVGRKAGSIGIAGCFSFYPAKILGGLGDGGGVTTNSEEVAEKIRLYRDHGQKTKSDIVCYAWTSRLDNLQAAVLNVKFNYLPDWIKRRQEIAEIYNKGLAEVGKIKLPPKMDTRHFDVFQNYVLRVHPDRNHISNGARKRDELFEVFKRKRSGNFDKRSCAGAQASQLGAFSF